MPELHRAVARCACGSVEFTADGAPILPVTCYCDDCQAGAREIERLPGATQILDADGGTEYLLYRRDRMRVTKGAEHLQDHRLTSGSKTRRIVASCCQTAMVLDFAPAHWLTAYRARFGPDAPPIEMRVMTKFAPGGAIPDDGIPSYKTHSWRFLARVAAAWIPMLLRRP